MSVYAAEPVDILARLVAADTRNPGGDEPALARLLHAELARHAPDRLELVTVPRAGLADGAYVHATWGREPDLLVNIHLDTVPANAGWSGDPLAAEVKDGQLRGLGSADTKGAIAALLVALTAARPGRLAVLLSGDEERASACMRAFLASGRAAGLRRAIVCEPTSLRAGVRHRGVFSATVTAHGEGGHSSRADRMDRPVVTLARVAVALDAMGRRWRDRGPAGFEGLCMNVAGVEGGVAFNVVPSEARLIFSMRPSPGADVAALRSEIDALVREAVAAEHGTERFEVRWSVELDHEPFATRDLESFRPLLGPHADAPVDLAFWTEAALLQQAGVDAVVIGPGDIAQAHAADEHVPLADLAAARDLFEGILRASHADR